MERRELAEIRETESILPLKNLISYIYLLFKIEEMEDYIFYSVISDIPVMSCKFHFISAFEINLINYF